MLKLLLTKYLLYGSEGFPPVASVFLPDVLFDMFTGNHSRIDPCPHLK